MFKPNRLKAVIGKGKKKDGDEDNDGDRRENSKASRQAADPVARPSYKVYDKSKGGPPPDGDDDMGVLVILYLQYDETEEDFELVGTDVEVGYRMEPYLTPTMLGTIIDDTLYNDEYNWLLDVAVAKMHNDILNEIYVDAYGDTAIAFDQDDYFDFLMEYNPPSQGEGTTSMNTLDFVLSPYVAGWCRISIVLPYLFLFLFGGTIALGNTGGGGSSGGMGLRRRR